MRAPSNRHARESSSLASADASASEARPPCAESSARFSRETELDFETVYVRHLDFACRSLRLLGVGAWALEDAAQEVFWIVSRRLPEFAGQASLKTWIFAIVQRVASNQRRSQRRKWSRLEPLAEGLAGPGSNPEAQAAAAQSLVLIQRFCADLDEARCALLVLALIEDVPVRELAEAQRVPLHTMYSRVRSLREALRLFLERSEAERG